MPTMPFKIKEAILGTAIAVIFVFFIVYGIKVFYKEPKYEQFCKVSDLIDATYDAYEYPARVKEPIGNMCGKAIDDYESFRKDCLEKQQDVVFEYDNNGCQIATSCTSCSRYFRNALNIYNRNVFIVSGIIGIIVIIIGAVLNLTSVSAGLFGGGILTIIYGTMNYWSELADWARFVILGIALVVLIYLGYRGFSILGFGQTKKSRKK